MAESDNRLETLEDEVKVLKGEVKRTLVDLRALLMREDSPLSEGALARRAAAASRGVVGDAAITEVHQMPDPKATNPATPPSVPEESPADHVLNPVDAPGTPPQPVEPSIPVPPVPPSPGSPASADQELRLAEQERRMAEQERRMAEQGIDQERRLLEQERKLLEREQELWGSNGRGQDLELGDHYHVPADNSNEGHGSAGGERPGMLEEEDWLEEQFSFEGTPQTRSVRNTPSPAQSPHEEARPWPRKGRPVASLRDVRAEEPVEEGWLEPETQEAPDAAASPAQDSPSSRVYDEYRALLEEHLDTRGTIEDEPAVPGRPLDVNLLSNLMYWASLAKQQVGGDQLSELLELYIQSGHSRPELQELLVYISNMVDAPPSTATSHTQVCVDLMFHLHGILTGGLPVIKIPQVKLSGPGKAAPDLDS